MATITVQDLALELDTDARTARKFLRSVTPKDDQPGKGSRWAIEKRDIRSLRSKFTKFTEAEAARREARAAKQLAEEDAKVQADEADMIADTDEADIEPTEADLDAIMLDED